MSKEKIKQVLRYTIIGLPLAGVALTNLLPISARTNQFLVMVTLIWFQVFILFEVFSGK